MTSEVLPILVDAFRRESHSLAQYLAESWPWTHSRDREALELVRSIMADERRVLAARTVARQIEVSRTTLWRMWRTGLFPKPIKISRGRVGFLASDIEQWLASKRSERG